MHHRPFSEGAQDGVLERLRHERQPEHEVEDVGAGEKRGERGPLLRLAAEEARSQVERAVCLRVKGIAVEDDERCVDAALSQRLDVRPRDPGGVDRAVDDAERAAHVGEPLVPPRARSSWSTAT